MKSDPPRIADLMGSQPSEVELVRAMIRSGREELAPLSEMQNALRAAQTGRRSLGVSTHLLWPGVPILALAIAIGAGWLAWSRDRGPDAAPPVPETASRMETAPSSHATPANAASTTTPEPAPEPVPVPVSVESLPSANRRPAPGAKAPSVGETSCSDEVDLIDEADAALRDGKAAAALALTEQHAERCPTGTFIQERERIAIEALAKLGRLDAMRERARAFEERFPSSPHLRRVRAVVERQSK